MKTVNELLTIGQNCFFFLSILYIIGLGKVT